MVAQFHLPYCNSSAYASVRGKLARGTLTAKSVSVSDFLAQVSNSVSFP